MHHTLGRIIVAVVLASGCGQPFWHARPSASWRPPALSDEPAPVVGNSEYAVYSAALVAYRADRDYRYFFVLDSTLAMERLLPLSPSMLRQGQDNFEAAIADLQGKSGKALGPAEEFDRSLQVVLIGDSIFAPPPANGQSVWERVYRAYEKPSGVVAFSRVGFNADTTRAVVWVDVMCAPMLCGGGGWELYARAPGKAWVRWDEIGQRVMS